MSTLSSNVRRSAFEWLCCAAISVIVCAVLSPVLVAAKSVRGGNKAVVKANHYANTLYAFDYDSRPMLQDCMQEGAFVSDGGGCMDNGTGLVWGESYYIATGGVSGFPNFYEAGSYCESSTQGGFTDWRVPTGAELIEAAGNGISNYVDFAHYGSKFSSTTRKGNKEVLSVDLDTAMSNWILIKRPGNPPSYSRIDVHCVR